MAALDTGQYIITNAKNGQRVYLRNSDSYEDTDLFCSQEPGNGGTWSVVLLGNGNYRIRNCDLYSLAKGETNANVSPGDKVVGGNTTHWKIVETTLTNRYWICSTMDPDICWSLGSDNHEGCRPIIFGTRDSSPEKMWRFTKLSESLSITPPSTKVFSYPATVTSQPESDPLRGPWTSMCAFDLEAYAPQIHSPLHLHGRPTAAVSGVKTTLRPPRPK